LGPLEPGSDRTVVLTVPPGASSREVADLLEHEGIIRDRLFFRLLLRIRREDSHIKAGEYRLGPGMSALELASRLLRGEVVQYPVTIPEGLTVQQVIKLLVDRGWGDPEVFRALLRDPSLRPTSVPEDPRLREPLEGYLFPDTYLFARGVSERQILRAMLNRMEAVLTQELRERALELGMEIHQVVTLASIIEREAVVAEERAVISAVFHNRLRLNMKLDACPTVRYALDKPSREPLLLRDLEVDSPYNTYRHPGLPPGPIANPGKASLLAALYPAEVKYLYFVSRNDGTHVFSHTLAEHERAARLYGQGFR